MAKVRPDLLSEVDEAFGRYEEEVRAAGLEANTERTYLLQFAQFHSLASRRLRTGCAGSLQSVI